jgi:hypothetical protein
MAAVVVLAYGESSATIVQLFSLFNPNARFPDYQSSPQLNGVVAKTAVATS